MATRNILAFNTTELFVETVGTTDTVAVPKISVTGDGSGVGIDVGGYSLTNIADPTNPLDAVNLRTLQSQINGLDVHAAVRVATTANVDIATGGLLTIDGVTLADGDRVLVRAQTAQAENGIYVVHAGAWTRAADANAADELPSGTFTFVTNGTLYGSHGFVLTYSGALTLGTTAITVTQFSGIGEIAAGNGVQLSANTVSVLLAANSGLQFTGNTIDTLLDANGGLQKGSSGLAVKPDAAGGLLSTSSGVAVKLANADTLSKGSSGLDVVGVPAQFKIGGTATSTNVTAANLATLTAGPSSDASALHTHSNLVSAQSESLAALFTASQALGAGVAVYPSGSDTVGRVDTSAATFATTPNKAHAIGVTTASIANGATGNVVTAGPADGVLSGATAGDVYFAGSTGAPVLGASLSTGDRVIRLGYALNATDLFVAIQDLGKRY